MKPIVIIAALLLVSCTPVGSSRETARFKGLADKELAAEGIDPSRYDTKQVLIGAKRVVVNYESSSSKAVMEGQPVLVFDRADGSLILIHIQQ